MYMAIPSGDVLSKQATKQTETHLIQVISSLNDEPSAEEHSKFWKEISHPAQELEELYNACKNATFKFKHKYDEIKKNEKILEELHKAYYEALSSKKKHEEDREKYFKYEQELLDCKKDFIDESQNLALDFAKYVEFSQRFSINREQLFGNLLRDVRKLKKDKKEAVEEKQRIQNEKKRLDSSVCDLKQKLKKADEDLAHLKANGKLLEQSRDRVKKELEWAMRQNVKLKEANSRCERDFLSNAKQLQEAKEEEQASRARDLALRRCNDDLQTRLSQTEVMAKGLEACLQETSLNAKLKFLTFEEETTKLRNTVAESEKKNWIYRTNNHKLMIKTQQLQKRLMASEHAFEAAKRGKLQSILVEHKTRKRNVELSSHQLLLINEMLELKTDFFDDQERIRRGAIVNRKLEREIGRISERVKASKKDNDKLKK